MIKLPVLPLRDVVVYPKMILPLFVGREKSVGSVRLSVDEYGERIFLVAQKDPRIEEPSKKDLYQVGTIANVVQTVNMADGSMKILVEGVRRGILKDFIETGAYYIGSVEEVEESGYQGDEEVEVLARSLLVTFEEYIKETRNLPMDVVKSVQRIENPSELADVIASNLPLSSEVHQSLLETVDVKERMERLLDILEKEMEESRKRGARREEKRTAPFIGKLKEFHREHSGSSGKEREFSARNEFEELEEKIKKKGMPKEVEEKALEELRKLSMMPPMSAEATVVRNYIDWLISLPWRERTKDRLDLDRAKKILDEDHYGLEKVKERILEFIAVQKLVDKTKGPILCFVGPPGVGKTSLAKSIARALGRKFVRVSLGGVRDEAEIRGHRRTYVGALPGRIIQGMRRAGVINPLFLLDEIDKLGHDFRGDPASALLEVLDPEQNFAFSDHYLEVDYDLSNVLFITTANTLYTIPPALLDRLEVIRIPGYTEEEKVEIAKQYLIPKEMRASGLNEDMVRFTRGSIVKVIREYTKEAGVRNLQREIGNICRKVARRIVEKGEGTKMVVSTRLVERFLGPPRYKDQEFGKVDEIGVAQGLAWTETGGEVLAIETAVMKGKGELIITGKLGDVMQESAKAAVSYVRTRASYFNIPEDFYKKFDIHIHVPEGAIPKDGPSAGITMAVSILSALARIPVRKEVAMTGEITLRGKVLPIGGLKEKILAAYRAGIKKVIIPKGNVKDLKDIPKKILKQIEVVPVEHMDEVIREALLLEGFTPRFDLAKYQSLTMWNQ